MKLRGINFGHVFNAAGACNFFGDGYWFHKWLHALGLLDFSEATLITKTITWYPVGGNMPLESDGMTPRERMPNCIIVKPFKGVALNAVGLSNFGAEHYFNQSSAGHRWQDRTEPFLISFMSVGKTREERLKETLYFRDLLVRELPKFKAEIGLQLNFSCPNVGHKQAELVPEIEDALNAFMILNTPIICKFNALLNIDVALRLERHPAFDALSMSNTIPWGELDINWKGLFGSDISPLSIRLNDPNIKGGLSGKPLLPIVENWIKNCRLKGFRKPIMGGGGVLCKNDALRLIGAGASSIEIGSAAFLRPWRVSGIIDFVNDTLGGS